ncbi:ABC transporter ATP-binding protein [Aureimonas flava]|uniref:ABC transporter ATP-binding protein n=1 Tax=Aureimonas flava TaxID=2320271 RepID=A0A3A1WI55_9HYPH|nr:ATP-binding cassette domain-containing protein [Aureimonas flava]RIX98007.1 ABC transporter ATP-binding protein [Aureimonas flava]
MTDAAIRIEDARKIYPGGGGFLSRRREPVHAVAGVTLRVARGETLAIVGESGSGKSTLARMLVGLVEPSGGRFEIGGRDAAALRREGPRAYGRAIQYVFQDPIASLNPRKMVRTTLGGVLERVAGIADAGGRAARMAELMRAVDMEPGALDRYPHEFSGGQAQRIAIARALAAGASVLVLDEPVSALDVSVQAQVLLLLEDLKARFALTYLFISHDLAVVEAVADRVAVMQAGRIVEMEASRTLFAAPREAYTRELFASAPRLEGAFA